MPPGVASSRAALEGIPPRELPVQRVLLVGPDDGDRRALHLILDGRGLDTAAVTTTEQAARWLADHRCDLVIADAGAVAPLRGLGAPILALAPPRDVAASLRALDHGALDCLVGSPDESAVILALLRVARLRPSAGLPDDGEAAPGHGVARLLGSSAAMSALRATIVRIAGHRSTVLISGESGTGKELVARAVHEESGRRDRRFVAVNCAAIPPTLLESELFGHCRGAFTDAVRDRAGLFETADGGTLFLDEVGELPPALQVKLLRVIQEHEIRRVGATESIQIDVRLIAATLRDLPAEVARGAFREDLYYRLNVLPVAVPPLRDRPGDVADLIDAFVERHRQRHGRGAGFTPEAIALLATQPWPGNVRQLENTVERALVLAESALIDPASLASHTRAEPGAAVAPTEPDDAELSIKKATRSLEIDLIRRALGATRGNRTTAARLLEISHRALLYKIKEYGL